MSRCEKFEDAFRRAAGNGAAGGCRNGTVQQDGVGSEGIQQGVVAKRRIIQPQFAVERLFTAQKFTRADAFFLREGGKLVARQRGFLVVNDSGLNTALAQVGKRCTRGGATRVVIKDNGHGFP